MARRCGPAAILLLALALGAAWGVAADDDDRCTAGWQPVEAGPLLDVAADVASRVSELANATGVLTCAVEPLDVVDCPRAWQGATRHRLYLNVTCVESGREVVVNLEVDALGAADGTVQGIDVDVERVTVDGQRVGDDLEDLFGDDDPREDTMETLEDRIEDIFGDRDDDLLGDDSGDDDGDDN
ncbi:hypothetical protein C2E21_4259 [Chlorella sorokiniana]|jgi:hypothetical protein|uniref:Uncharacterized protein n=1 Tax=Chlorella sorokiniana TaxID=3076 RepID=A0A2P6TSN5_CHLSO|nr:hypothetical protein C2E21_4259 [Chlorella sorokiniana]|eukprot:PRW57066.1 hypothetical protein C2E21_4259 [Chlorella sorokiniana]